MSRSSLYVDFLHPPDSLSLAALFYVYVKLPSTFQILTKTTSSIIGRRPRGGGVCIYPARRLKFGIRSRAKGDRTYLQPSVTRPQQRGGVDMKRRVGATFDELGGQISIPNLTTTLLSSQSNNVEVIGSCTMIIRGTPPSWTQVLLSCWWDVEIKTRHKTPLSALSHVRPHRFIPWVGATPLLRALPHLPISCTNPLPQEPWLRPHPTSEHSPSPSVSIRFCHPPIQRGSSSP